MNRRAFFGVLGAAAAAGVAAQVTGTAPTAEPDVVSALPCPVCGEAPRLSRWGVVDDCCTNGVEFACSCRTDGHMSVCCAYTERDVVELWNDCVRRRLASKEA